MTVGARQYFGGSQFRQSGADIPIAPGLARGWVVKFTTTGLAVTLPDARTVGVGTTILVLNEGANDCGAKDASGTRLLPTSGLGSIQVGYAAAITLVEASDAAGVWRVRLSTIGAAATALPFRSLWVVGGNTTGTTPDGTTVYRFDGAAWSTGGSPANPHIEAAVLPLGTPFGGRALFAGHRDAGGTLYPYADELDEAGVWSAAVDAPYAVGRAAGAGVDGVGYLYGGEGLYDVSAYQRPSWAARNGLGLPIARGGAARFADRVLLCPGEASGAPWGSIVPKVHWPAADAFYDATAPAQPRRGFGCWGADGRVYVAGGYVPGAGTPQLQSVERWDPVSDAWSTLSVMSLGLRYAGAAAGGNAGGYFAGGRDGSDAERAEFASFTEDTWFASGRNMPGAKAECAGAVL